MNDKLSVNFSSYYRSTDRKSLGTNLAKTFLLQVGWDEILSFSFFSFFHPPTGPKTAVKKREFYQIGFKSCFIGGLVV